MPKIRVFLADDHAVLRAGLKLLINSQADMEVVGEAADTQQAVAGAAAAQPDVLVLDISMPGGGGISAIAQVRQQSPATRVLMLSMHLDPAYIRAALAAGAAGYVAKRSADADLLSGIRALYANQSFVDPALAETVAGRVAQSPDAVPGEARLSTRERQALELLVRGYTNQQVGDRLQLSVKTAETYRARLSRKLGLRDRADFIRYGIEKGLLLPGQPPADTNFPVLPAASAATHP